MPPQIAPFGIDRLNAELVVTTGTPSSLKLITLEEIPLLQNHDEFCCRIQARFGEGVWIPFELTKDNVLFWPVDRFALVIVLHSFVSGVVNLIHHAKMAVHPGGRRFYQFLGKWFSWPEMSVNCNAIAINCDSWTKNSVTLRRNSVGMRLFSAKLPLELLQIDTFGQFLTTKQGSHFPLMLTDRFAKANQDRSFFKYISSYNCKSFCGQLDAILWGVEMALVR